MNIWTALAFFLACAAALPAGAQSFGNPAGLAADTPGIETGDVSTKHANNTDRLFVRQAAIGGNAEVELSKAAQSNAQAQATRDFAQQMVKDHQAMNDRLLSVGGDLNPAIQKRQLDPEHEAISKDLQTKGKSSDFDREYLTAQVQDHQKTVQLLLWEIDNGQNADLVRFASDSLPTVMNHLEMAKARLMELSAATDRRQTAASAVRDQERSQTDSMQ
jgi:putative membrane protein